MLATATLSLTACGSDENGECNPTEGKTAKLELTLVGTPAASRTTGTLPTTDESQINRLTVAVFTGTSGNPVNALHEFTGDDIKRRGRAEPARRLRCFANPETGRQSMW